MTNKFQKINKDLSNFKFQPSIAKRGFTLVEIIVSVGLFTVVMLASLGAFMSIADASRKAQTLRTAMDNLNFAVENIVREIRTGSGYGCGAVANCSDGSNYISLTNSTGDTVSYRLVNGKTIYKKVIYLNPGKATIDLGITSPEITISSLRFYITGESVGDGLQPRVLISIKGIAGKKDKLKSEFNLQTTISQRKIDS